MVNTNSQYYQNFRENGKLMAGILHKGIEFAQTHFNLADIDSYIDTLIVNAGGEPGFKKVPGYRWATCISVNDVLVHGIPRGTLKPGDIVNIDTGMFYKGTTSDTSKSFVVGEPTPDQAHFLKVGRETLIKAIHQAKPGNRIYDIAEAIQTNIEAARYNVTRNLTGHGIGKTMHEEPPIPCFVSRDPMLKTRIEVGMVLAVEVMYMKGNWPLTQDGDGWSLHTRDGSDCAVFENDIIVTPHGPEIITPYAD